MRTLGQRWHPSHLWDVWVMSDPDLGRWRKGLRAALGAAVVRLWNDPARWQAGDGDGRRVRLDAQLVAAVDRTVR